MLPAPTQALMPAQPPPQYSHPLTSETMHHMLSNFFDTKIMPAMQYQSQQLIVMKAALDVANENSSKKNAKIQAVKSTVQQQALKIKVLELERMLWHMQTEQDRPQRKDKLNTLYITPTSSSTSPFLEAVARQLSGTITSISSSNDKGGVQAKFSN